MTDLADLHLAAAALSGLSAHERLMLDALLTLGAKHTPAMNATERFDVSVMVERVRVALSLDARPAIINPEMAVLAAIGEPAPVIETVAFRDRVWQIRAWLHDGEAVHYSVLRANGAYYVSGPDGVEIACVSTDSALRQLIHDDMKGRNPE